MFRLQLQKVPTAALALGAVLAVTAAPTITGRTETPTARYGMPRPGAEVEAVEPAEALPVAIKAKPPAHPQVPARSGEGFWAWAADPVVTSEPRPASSLTVTYVATAEMLCWAHAGLKTGVPCALTPGTSGIVRWSVMPLIGTDRPLPSCTSSISAAEPVSTCRVTWPTYGDQEVEAWLELPYDKTAAGKTVTTDVVAPVDLAAGQEYLWYGNETYGDCSMAAAADYVQVETKKPLDATTVVDEYFILDHGHDDGLTDPQLFGLWEHGGIGGTVLASAVPLTVTRGAVEGYLLHVRKPLYSDVDLPFSWEGGGGHSWLIVGFSNYGPLVLTWTEEVQLTWAAWKAMTTNVDALTIQPKEETAK